MTPSLLAHPQLLSPALLLFGGHGEIWRRKRAAFFRTLERGSRARWFAESCGRTNTAEAGPCTPEGSSQVRKWLSDHGVNHCKPKKEHVYMFLPDMGMQQWRFVVKSWQPEISSVFPPLPGIIPSIADPTWVPIGSSRCWYRPSWSNTSMAIWK